jgi:hypothetical protein
MKISELHVYFNTEYRFIDMTVVYTDTRKRNISS